MLRRTRQRPSKRRERGRSWRRRGYPGPGTGPHQGAGPSAIPSSLPRGADINAQLAQACELEAKLAEEYRTVRQLEDHVWFEDRWMVASLCDE
jgi:hypothetical protein